MWSSCKRLCMLPWKLPGNPPASFPKGSAEPLLLYWLTCFGLCHTCRLADTDFNSDASTNLCDMKNLHGTRPVWKQVSSNFCSFSVFDLIHESRIATNSIVSLLVISWKCLQHCKGQGNLEETWYSYNTLWKPENPFEPDPNIRKVIKKLSTNVSHSPLNMYILSYICLSFPSQM